MKKQGEAVVQDNVLGPNSKREDDGEDNEEEQGEEESARQTPESPESGQSLFSVTAPSPD